MKTNQTRFTGSKLTLAVQGALLAMVVAPSLAFAQDDMSALTHPTNSFEIGVGGTSVDSAKFGEYNGLDSSGANLIGNLNIKGGDAYDQNGGVTRWGVKGTDLGTTSRELGGTVSHQGQWELGINYYELRHNITDSYQTPLIGSMGGNSFTLPSNFGYIDTAANSKAGTQVLSATQLSDFQTRDVHSDRKNTTFTAGYNFDRRWSFKFDYNRLDQSGAKLISPGTDAVKLGGYSFGGEKTLMLMNPTNYTTDTFNLAVNWAGENGYATVSYFGSFFRDGYNGLTFPNPYATGSGVLPALPIDTLSTAPSNDFHQLNLTGGYSISPTTKLAGGFSYGRNAQDESYPFAVMDAGGLPQNSLNALVKTTHADLKLTNQTTHDLTLAVGFKYNERNNQTASNIYNFLNLGGDSIFSVNIPMSNRKTQIELAGDYRISSKNRLHVGYSYEDIKRWCNDPAANSAQSPSAPAGYYAQNAGSCVQIPQSKESKLDVGYRLTASDAVSFNAGYSYASRKADVLNAFYNPMQNANGVEGFENFGYRAYFDASRNEQLLKTGVNWQANEKLSVGLNVRYVDDKYTDSPLGVQNGNSWTTNLDSTYSFSETSILSGYLSVQKRSRDMTSAALRNTLALPGKVWTNQLKDEDNTVGMTFTKKGLMAGKLEIKGDLSYSKSTTGYSTQVPYLATCSAATLLTCGNTPDINNETTQLKITGIYQLDKASKVAVGYLFQKLSSTDYYYNGYQYTYTPTGLLPTNEQLPSYSVHAISVSYIRNF